MACTRTAWWAGKSYDRLSSVYAGAPVDGKGARHQGFEWTRRKVSGLNFVLETSTHLVNWHTDTRAGVEVLHSVDDLSERVRIIDPDPVDSHLTRFIRMHVKE
jgi:hypothetical protein